MAMYDLEDVGEANLKRSETSGETLVKGKRIDELLTEDCKAGSLAALEKRPEPWWRKALKWLSEHVMSVAVTVIAAIIISYLGLS